MLHEMGSGNYGGSGSYAGSTGGGVPSPQPSGPPSNNYGMGPGLRQQAMAGMAAANYGNGMYTPSSIGMSPRSTVDELGQHLQSAASIGGETPTNSNRLQAPVQVSGDVQGELLHAVAAEVCVYLAKVASKGKRPERNAHAAARRLARTMVSLGPQQGPAFGQHMLRLVSAQVSASAGELSTLAFWWSNVAHLRGLLSAPAVAAQAGVSAAVSGTDGMWAQLVKLERTVFEQVLAHVWNDVLLPIVSVDGAKGAAQKATAATKRAQQASGQGDRACMQ